MSQVAGPKRHALVAVAPFQAVTKGGGNSVVDVVHHLVIQIKDTKRKAPRKGGGV